MYLDLDSAPTELLFNPSSLLRQLTDTAGGRQARGCVLLSIMSYHGIYAVVLTTNKSGFNPKTKITMGVKTP